MDWAANLDAAAFGALVSAAAGVLVPRIIERVPEPEPEEPAEDGGGDPAGAGGAGPAEPRFEGGSEAEEPPKELYHAIADLPGLLWKSVLAAGVTGGLIGIALGWQWALLVWLPLVPLGISLAVIDWRTRLLPTWLVMRTYVLVVVLALLATAFTQDWQDLVRAAIGWVGAGLLYGVLWFIYPRGLGYGDVRLSACSASPWATSGRPSWSWACTPGSCSVGSGGALLTMLRVVHRKHVPFGPFMLVGAVVGLLAGDWLGSLTAG